MNIRMIPVKVLHIRLSVKILDIRKISVKVMRIRTIFMKVLYIKIKPVKVLDIGMILVKVLHIRMISLQVIPNVLLKMHSKFIMFWQYSIRRKNTDIRGNN